MNKLIKVISKKPKILIIENSIGWTGAFKSIFFISKSLSGSFEFHYVISKKSSNDIYLKEYFKNILKIRFVEIGRSAKILLYFPLLIWNTLAIHNYCKSNNIKIVHVNDLYNLTGILLKLIKPDYKVIYHIRLLQIGFPKLLYKFWSRSISNFADEIIVVSSAVKEDFKKWSNRTVTVIYDTIPLLEKNNFEVKTNNEIITLLYIANYTRGKGQDLALSAFINAVKLCPFIRLKFMGHDFGIKKNKLFKEELNKTIKKHNIEQFVEFIEPTVDIEKAMKESDIVLNFSGAESFSMTCYEALYYGKPLIATDCGGPSELFEHGISGWLVPNNDVVLMTEAISLLSSNKSLRDELGKKAKEYISVFIKKNNIKESLNSIYRRIEN